MTIGIFSQTVYYVGHTVVGHVSSLLSQQHFRSVNDDNAYDDGVNICGVG